MARYERDELERVLGVLWDPSIFDGIPNPTAPEEGMPRGSSDPTKRNTHWAIFADVRNAWTKTSLTLRERSALLLRYGCDSKFADVGAAMGTSKQTAEETADRGLRKMLAFLNQDNRHLYYDDEEMQ